MCQAGAWSKFELFLNIRCVLPSARGGCAYLMHAQRCRYPTRLVLLWFFADLSQLCHRLRRLMSSENTAKLSM
jgi:hypothetical protein